MKVTWTDTFEAEFDLDQAQEDFNFIMENYGTDIDTAIYKAVEANWNYGDGQEFIDTTPAIKQCAKALRERIGGVQMKMELD